MTSLAAAAPAEPAAPVLTLSVSTGVLTVAATWEAAAAADWAGLELIPSEVNATACPCSTTTAPAGAAGAISVAGVAAFDSPSEGASLAADASNRRAL